VFGHERVAVLDGGFAGWTAAGLPVEAGAVRRPAARFEARLRPDMVRSLDAMRSLVSAGNTQVLDARGRGRFTGSEPEPRPGLRSGHHPGARNLPYGELVGPDGAVLPVGELERRLRAAGVDLAQPVVTTCGSGVTACALALALELVGHRDYAVYDGSWTEWATRADTPVETGPPA
jgi:thiosulfate/3-mercaptopyruvate sulfurtransferase